MKKLLLLLIINVACNNELNKENVNQEAILFNNNIKTLHYKYICDFQDTELFKSQIISNPKVLNYDECLEEINYCALNETNTLYLTADFLSNCLFNQNDKIDYVETKLIKESLKIVEFDNSYNEITVDTDLNNNINARILNRFQNNYVTSPLIYDFNLKDFIDNDFNNINIKYKINFIEVVDHNTKVLLKDFEFNLKNLATQIYEKNSESFSYIMNHCNHDSYIKIKNEIVENCQLSYFQNYMFMKILKEYSFIKKYTYISSIFTKMNVENNTIILDAEFNKFNYTNDEFNKIKLEINNISNISSFLIFYDKNIETYNDPDVLTDIEIAKFLNNPCECFKTSSQSINSFYTIGNL